MPTSARSGSAVRTRAAVAAALVVAALSPAPAGAARVTDLVARGGLVQVPLDDHDSITVTIPDAVLRHARPNGRTTLRATLTGGAARADGEMAPTAAAPAPDLGAGGAARYPAGPVSPGTVGTVAGGYCDGYPATAATISPVRAAYDRTGRLWWVDDDQSIVNGGNHSRASSLLRTLDANGRVRTVASLVEPQEGRAGRQDQYSHFRSRPVADPFGGVLVNVVHDNFAGENAKYRDGPVSGAIYRVTADGRRERVAGRPDLPLPQGGRGDADGARATESVLGYVTAVATDPEGNVYFAEAVEPTYFDNPRANVVRVVNRTGRALRYYEGTPYEVVVAPGTIGTIAADLDTGDLQSLLPGRGNGGSARRARFAMIPALQVHRGVLYVLDILRDPVRWARAEDIGTAQVRAVNLGFDGAASTAYGVALPVGVIQTVAGSQTPVADSTGDGGPALAATFHLHSTVQAGDFVIDRAGTLYVADTLADRVRAVDPRTAVIRTVAGTGTGGEAVEAAPAADAALWRPVGLALDPHDRLVVADYLNARLRRLDGDGRLRTVAGRGPTPCGDGQLATGSTVNGGAAFGDVADTAVDSAGRVYVADVRHHQVRRVDPDGRIRVVVGRPTRCVGNWVTGLADPGSCPGLGPQDGDGGGYGVAGLAAPHFLAVDAYDNLYISDVDRVRYVNFGDRPVSVHGVTVAPGTIATVVTYPSRAVRVTGLAYGVPLDVEMPAPIGDLALDDAGNLYVADPVLNRVYRLGPCGHSGLLVGTGQAPSTGGDGDGGPAQGANVSPRGLAFDPVKRSLLISDMNGSSTGALGGVAAEVGGNRIRAVNLGSRKTVVFGVSVEVGTIETVAGTRSCLRCSTGDGRPAIDAGISAGSTLAIGAGGRLYVTDPYNQRVRVVLPDGRIAGVTSFWPEGENAAAPAGYHGDGGPALDAWFGLRFGRNWQGHGVVGSVTATPDGDLLVSDASGRVRRIADAYDAPLRLASNAPGPPGAGAGFTATTVLHDDFPATLQGGTTAPDLLVEGDRAYVLGSRGDGRGCALWRVRPGAGRGGTDAAEFAGQPGVARSGAGLGGTGCAITPGATGGLAVTTSVRAGDADVSILAAASVADAAWRSNPAASLAARATGTALPASGVAFTGTENAIAYAATDGTIRVAASSDGTVYTDRGTLSVGPAGIGDLAVAPDGTWYLGLTTTAGGSAVHVARSSDGGRTWTPSTVHRATGDAARAALSPPSVAVDAAGAAYVTWSDDRAVFVSRRSPSGWSAPVAVATGVTGLLPTVAAGDAGRVAVAFYGAPGSRTAADPYVRWYGYLARSVDATASWDVSVATPESLYHGPLCVACPDGSLGRARVRLGGGGQLGIAFTLRSLGATAATTALAYVRPCAGPFLVASPDLPPCVQGTAVPPATARPDPPALPIVETPAIGPCSPTPPSRAPAPAPSADPAPRDEQSAAPSPDRSDPVRRVAVPPFVGRLPQPAPIDGRQPQPQTGGQGQQQAQGQGQAGAVPQPDEEEQAETIEEYAMSDRRATLPVGLYATSLLLATALGAVRTRQHVSRAGG